MLSRVSRVQRRVVINSALCNQRPNALHPQRRQFWRWAVNAVAQVCAPMVSKVTDYFFPKPATGQEKLNCANTAMDAGAKIFKDHQETERKMVETKSLIIAADANKEKIVREFEIESRKVALEEKKVKFEQERKSQSTDVEIINQEVLIGELDGASHLFDFEVPDTSKIQQKIKQIVRPKKDALGDAYEPFIETLCDSTKAAVQIERTRMLEDGIYEIVILRGGVYRHKYEFTENGIVTEGETMHVLVGWQKRKIVCKDRIDTKAITKSVDGNIEDSKTEIVRNESGRPLPKIERMRYILDAYPQSAQISNLPKENSNSDDESNSSN
jgi:hypothetical protein